MNIFSSCFYFRVSLQSWSIIHLITCYGRSLVLQFAELVYMRSSDTDSHFQPPQVWLILCNTGTAPNEDRMTAAVYWTVGPPHPNRASNSVFHTSRLHLANANIVIPHSTQMWHPPRQLPWLPKLRCPYCDSTIPSLFRYQKDCSHSPTVKNLSNCPSHRLLKLGKVGNTFCSNCT